MSGFELSKTEMKRRKDLSDHTRKMILSRLAIEEQDETSVMMGYGDYYLQISFSNLHPLMVFCLARNLENADAANQLDVINELNLKSILGSHSINREIGCYSYRATHWLDTELEPARFQEILERCVLEAEKGYHSLAT